MPTSPTQTRDTMTDSISPFLTRPLRSEAEAKRDRILARLEEDKRRWERDGWADCEECHGTGRVMHCHRLDQPDTEVNCIECNGNGQVRVDFWDWLEAQNGEQP